MYRAISGYRIPKRRKVHVQRRQLTNRFNLELEALLDQLGEDVAQPLGNDSLVMAHDDSSGRSSSGGDVLESAGSNVSGHGADADDEASMDELRRDFDEESDSFVSSLGCDPADHSCHPFLNASLPAETGDLESFDRQTTDSGSCLTIASSDEDGTISDVSEGDLRELLDDEQDIDGPKELKDFLAKWIVSENVPGTSANRLLKGLKTLENQESTFDRLPLDVRTLLKTPRKVTVDHLEGGGTYYHMGLERGIRSRLHLLPMEKITSVIRIFINVDGLPLSRSSKSEFWPILGLIQGEQTPFAIGLYHGTTKPVCPNEFLQKFVREANHLKANGLIHRRKYLDVSICGFCLDAPARSFVCGIVGHTGYESCPKCVTRGIHYKKPRERKGRVTYPDMDAALRTHQSFVDRDSPGHHHQRTILEDLGLDMVKDFPTDYMHLVCIGVMKKLLLTWQKRAAPHHVISQDNVDEISRRLLHMRNSVPGEFVRRPRSLEELPRWKATELRQFLLYTGPVVLKGVLPTTLYKHFLSLHVAIKILASEQFCFIHNEYSQQLLRHFVSESEKLYGAHFITYNVHGLIHLPNDVLRFGPLDSFSCFAFENFLQTLKRKVRRSLNPLVQVVKRLVETTNTVEAVPSVSNPQMILSHAHSRGPLPDPYQDHHVRTEQFQTIVYKSWRLTTQHPNNCVYLDDGSIVLIDNIVKHDDFVEIVGREFEEKSCLYDPPFNVQGILKFKNVNYNALSNISSWAVDAILCKGFAIPNPWQRDDNDEDFESNFYAVFPLFMEDKFR